MANPIFRIEILNTTGKGISAVVEKIRPGVERRAMTVNAPDVGTLTEWIAKKMQADDTWKEASASVIEIALQRPT